MGPALVMVQNLRSHTIYSLVHFGLFALLFDMLCPSQLAIP